MDPNNSQPNMDLIAQAVGVSRTTVHRALRDKGRISESTRRRILAEAQRLGYRPNLLARALSEKRTATLGVILVAADSYWTSQLIAGAEQAAREHQHSILLATTSADPALERRMADLLLAKGVDGLIVLPADPETNAGFYRGLLAEGVRCVFVDREMRGVPTDAVTTDNLQVGRLAAEHLLSTGRRRLAVVTRASGAHWLQTSVQQRTEGFTQLIRAAGLPPPRLLEVEAAPDQDPVERVRDQVAPLLIGNHRPDGFFGVGDRLAYGAVQALLEAGVRVPEEAGVVGVNDSEWNDYLRVPLTSVRQPMRLMGAEAVRLLLRRLTDGTDGAVPQRILLQPALIVRCSSAPLAARLA